MRVCVYSSFNRHDMSVRNLHCLLALFNALPVSKKSSVSNCSSSDAAATTWTILGFNLAVFYVDV